MTKLCDYYVINGPVDDTMESGAKNAVSKSDGGEECAIFLTTYGGFRGCRLSCHAIVSEEIQEYKNNRYW